jgi:hypothetical protein
MGCEQITGSNPVCCEYGFTIFDKPVQFNTETKEVFDSDRNLIGHGEPVIVDFETVGLNVTLIQK